MNQEKIGKLIKKIRIESKLSQKEFASKYGVTFQAVSKWENGKNIPDISILKEICNDYNLKIDDFLDAKPKKLKKKIVVIIAILLFLLLGILLCLIKHHDDFEFKTLTPACENFDLYGSVAYNKNKSIENVLEANGFKKLNNKFFDQKLPKFNATILLKDFSLKNIAKNTRNKINKSIKYGLSIKKASREDINILYKFIKNKKNHQINHYYNYFNAFNNSKNIDIFLIKIDFETCLINLRKSYDKELNKNNILIDKLMHYNNEENLTKKLASDKALTTYQEKIKIVTNYLAQQKEEFIAGAITIKYRNRVNILISGFDKKYKDFCPNYFLHYKLIQYYKKEYDFLDLNGITGDFNDDNPYKGLNEFKFGFKPLAFEYIGEFDFIINEGLYKSMLANGILFKEFNKKQKTITKE